MIFQKEHNARNLTTVHTDASLPWYITVSDSCELSDVVHYCRNNKLTPLMLGNGSNILIGDIPQNYVVIKILDDSIIVNGDTVFAKAGALLPHIVNIAYENSLEGIEWAYGIPGTLGGSIYMNSGAFNYEMIELLSRVYVIDEYGNEDIIPAKNLNASYRYTDIKKKNLIITSAEISLKKGSRSNISKVIKSYVKYRSETQPTGYSFGSTFKKFYDIKQKKMISAGYYIDMCGFKGYKVGGAKISEKHANFIINEQHASANEVMEIMGTIQSRVFEQYRIILEPEVRLWTNRNTLNSFNIQSYDNYLD